MDGYSFKNLIVRQSPKGEVYSERKRNQKRKFDFPILLKVIDHGKIEFRFKLDIIELFCMF